MVVIALSFLNSLSFDGSFGNEDTEASALSTIGKTITPFFAPIGIKEDNWPATVGLFTGVFAKEAVVGTLDALYSRKESAPSGAPDLIAETMNALNSILDNGKNLISGLADPLGISIEDSTDIKGAAAAQGVETDTLTNMAMLFGDQFSAFCYLVFILLYAPCVAVLGAITKEAGWRWTLLIFSWTTGLAYVTASCLYQIGTFSDHPQFSTLWLIGSAIISYIFVVNLKQVGKSALPKNIIPSVQVD
jgi:ferrous iron transport protein B